MAAHPWMTSDELIACISRKISMPLSQITFTEDDVLAFCNEELALSQIPSILEMHEEYLVKTQLVPLVAGQTRYSIPDRAIGMKLRDLQYQDAYGNIAKMTQITEEDKSFYVGNSGNSNVLRHYYIEGNDIVITPTPTATSDGSLLFGFFLRPNQLVRDARAAIVSSFCKDITISNAVLVAGNTVTIGTTVFTAVASGAVAKQFNIGASSIATATNLSSSITTDGTYTATNGAPSTATVTVTYSTLSTAFTSSNSVALAVQTKQCVRFTSVPTNITSSSYVDFLQTKPGHKIRTYDVLIGVGGVSGSTITFTSTDVPSDLVVGDYVCSSNECIIPQIPPDLHNGLAERACARILASMGDAQGLAAVNEKIKEIDARQGTLLDNRVDGSPRKITNRYSLLNQGPRRRF